MSTLSDLVTEARHLAAADVGNQAWASELVKQVKSAGDNDLGTMIVARAVLTRAVEEQAAEAARRAAEDEERRKAAARAAAERRAEAARVRNRQRRSRLGGQIATRGLTGLGYSVAAGVMVAFATWFPRDPTGAQVWSATQPILIACLVSAAMAMTVDWFLDDPGGDLRALCATIGVLIGASKWVAFMSAGPHQINDGKLAVMPWSLAIGWMLGGVLAFASRRIVAEYSMNPTSEAITRAAPWRLIPATLGGLTGVSALFFGNCHGDCGPALIGALQVAERASFLHINFLGIGGSVTAVVFLAALVCILHLAAPSLARVSPRLGVAAVTAEVVLGIVVFFAYTPNVVSVFVGWIVGMGS